MERGSVVAGWTCSEWQPYPNLVKSRKSTQQRYKLHKNLQCGVNRPHGMTRLPDLIAPQKQRPQLCSVNTLALAQGGVFRSTGLFSWRDPSTSLIFPGYEACGGAVPDG